MGVFLENEIYTKNANFFFIDLAKLPINNDNVILILFSSYHHCHVNHMPYVSICSRLIAISLYRYCALYWPIVTLVNPLYFLFLWFLWYIALDFVHLSTLWSSNIVYIALYIISVIALCIALRGTHEGNTSSIRLDSLAAPRAEASSLQNAR